MNFLFKMDQVELRHLTLFLPPKHSGIIVEVVDNFNFLHPWIWFRSSSYLHTFVENIKGELVLFEGCEGKIKIKSGILNVWLGDKQELVDTLGLKMVIINSDLSPRFILPNF